MACHKGSVSQKSRLQRLEALVFPAAQRSHQAVPVSQLAVPQLLSLNAFMPPVQSKGGGETASPGVVLSESRVRVPPCTLGTKELSVCISRTSLSQSLNSQRLRPHSRRCRERGRFAVWLSGQLSFQLVQLRNVSDSAVEFRLLPVEDQEGEEDEGGCPASEVLGSEFRQAIPARLAALHSG